MGSAFPVLRPAPTSSASTRWRRVNSVHPRFLDTDRPAGAIQHRGPWFREYIENTVPMGKLGGVEDIAEGCVYLASDATKFVTGSELVIDGGFLAR